MSRKQFFRNQQNSGTGIAKDLPATDEKQHGEFGALVWINSKDSDETSKSPKSRPDSRRDRHQTCNQWFHIGRGLNCGQHPTHRDGWRLTNFGAINYEWKESTGTRSYRGGNTQQYPAHPTSRL